MFTRWVNRIVLVCGLAAFGRPGCTAPATHAPDAGRASTTDASRSVKPGINNEFTNSDMDVDRWVQRFESESREIFHHREKIADAVGLRPGMTVADIGAGTGIFVEPFARRVGPAGSVLAVDIAPAFLERIDGLAEEHGLKNVRTVLCKEDSVELPDASVDAAFICDTYHHFEYPASTMASLHRALRPGGQVVIVDFIRIDGVSREWVLDHVRAGEEAVVSELRGYGFELMPDQPDDGFLTENYIIRLRKVD